jgi:hypothetical protein
MNNSIFLDSIHQKIHHKKRQFLVLYSVSMLVVSSFFGYTSYSQINYNYYQNLWMENQMYDLEYYTWEMPVVLSDDIMFEYLLDNHELDEFLELIEESTSHKNTIQSIKLGV